MEDKNSAGVAKALPAWPRNAKTFQQCPAKIGCENIPGGYIEPMLLEQKEWGLRNAPKALWLAQVCAYREAY